MRKSEKENDNTDKKPEEIKSQFTINRVTPGFNLVEIPGMRERIEREREIYYELYENNYDKIMRDVNALPSEADQWDAISKYLKLAYRLGNSPHEKFNSKSVVTKLEKEIARRTRIQKVARLRSGEKGNKQRKAADSTSSARELEESTRIINKPKMHWPGNSRSITFLFRSLFQFSEKELSDEELIKLLERYFVIGKTYDGSFIENEEMIQWPFSVLGIKYLFDQLSEFPFLSLGKFTNSVNKFIETYFANKYGERFKNLYKYTKNNIGKKIEEKVKNVILKLNEINTTK